MFKTRSFVTVSFLLIAALMLAACPAAAPAGGDGEAMDEGPIKVGAIFDLTGPTSDVGQLYSSGIRGYIDFVNAGGGMNGRMIELVSADYAYAVDQAEQLYSQYVNEDEVLVFSGWGTGDTEALRGRIGDDEIPFVSASYSAALQDPAEAPYNFLIGTSYSDQFILAIDRAADEGASTVALFHNDSPFGTSPLEDGREHAAGIGVEIINFPMPRGATDYTAELSQAAEKGATHIVVQNVSSPASTLAKNVDNLSLDMTIMCLNWCTNELLLELSGDAGDGIIGVNPFTFPSSGVAGLDEIAGHLESEGSMTLDEAGGLYIAGWTTMKVLMQGVQDTMDAGNDLTGANVRAALESLDGYDTGGITDPITFTGEDHAGNKTVQFFEASGGIWNPVSDRVGVSN